MNNKLNKAAMIIAKIAEIVLWVGTAFSVALLIFSAVGKLDWINSLAGSLTGEATELSITGFTLGFHNGATSTRGAFVIFFITMLLVFICLAMICRNINLIMKTTQGTTKFSKGATPFQPDNIRMIREIGIFFIAIAVIEFVMSIIAQAVLGANVEAQNDFTYIFVGMVVICLSQYFNYGMELQEDVDGLL